MPSSLFAPEKDFQAEIFYISSATETEREVKTILDHKPAHFVSRKNGFSWWQFHDNGGWDDIGEIADGVKHVKLTD